MAYRLHSTLKPEGDLYGAQRDAKRAMDLMVESLTRKGFSRVEYAVPPNREGAVMKNPTTDETVEMHISIE
jgi:hypothetical protein